MSQRFRGATAKSPSAIAAIQGSVAPPVPVNDMPENRSAEGRDMPQDDAPEGFDPAKWALMNRTQRRAMKRRMK